MSAPEWFTPRAIWKAALPGWPHSRFRTIERLKLLKKKEPRKVRPTTRRGGAGDDFHLSIFTADEQALLLESAERTLPAAGCSAKLPDPQADAMPAPAAGDYEAKRAELWQRFEATTERARKRATAAAEILRAADELLVQGHPKVAADKQIAAGRGISWKTIRRWRKKIRRWNKIQRVHCKPDDYAALLVDSRHGRGPNADYDSFIFDFYKSDFLRNEKPTRPNCYRDAVKAAKLRGVADGEIPSEGRLWRRLRREVTWQAIKYARHGTTALHRTHPAQRRDRATLRALEVVNGDGYRFNNLVAWPDGEVVRPLCFYFQDTHSGKILSWRIDRTENAGLVRLVIGDMIRAFGIPGTFVIDNTLAAASKWITGRSPSRHRFAIREDDPLGLIGQLGARHIATLPRVGGSSKPGERAGGDWDRDISRGPALAGSYVGHNPMARPERKAEPVPLDVFVEAVRAGMIEHNSRAGRRTPACRGVLSFDEAFERSFKTIVPRKPTAEQLRLCMLAAERIRCKALDGTVELFGNRFWGETTTAPLAGKEAVLRFDPENLQAGVYVYTLDGKYVGEAPCVKPTGFLDADAARDHNRRRRQNLRAHKIIARNHQTMTPAQLAAALPKPADPEAAAPRVVGIFRGRIAPPVTPDKQTKTPSLIERNLAAYDEIVARDPADWSEEERLFIKLVDRFGYDFREPPLVAQRGRKA